MAETEKPPKVKIFCALLYSDKNVFKQALEKLEPQLGTADFCGKEFSFDKTGYYEAEMGKDLKRVIVSFNKCIDPEIFTEIKVFTNRTEKILMLNGRRTVNIDPGYVDYMKVVLASAKYGPHKIYLRSGIYADLTLIYSKGKFSGFPWTFPDFRNSLYYNDLLTIRNIYKKQMNPTEVLKQ